MPMSARSLLPVSAVLCSALFVAPARPSSPTAPSGDVPSVQEMIAARTDVWGEAALRRPDGPSYEFFRDLLPPLVYSNAEFRYYPIVLSAPQAARKCRFVANGSGVNLLAKKAPMWYEAGRPIKFCVGQAAELFGSVQDRLEGPRYVDGWLPIVDVRYRSGDVTYRQEAFAPLDPLYSNAGAVMVRFTAVGNGPGRVEARIEPGKPLVADSGSILEGKSILVRFGSDWQWNPQDRTLVAAVAPNRGVELAVFTAPPESAVPPMTAPLYDRHREACANGWRELLAGGTALDVPETVVNNAWRSTLVGNFIIADGDRMNYSTGNAYAKLYQGECGDSLMSVLLYGHEKAARSMLRPIMEFYRENTRFHVSGHKLQLLSQYYWETRDADAVRANQDMWQRSLDLILNNLEADGGLLPKDRYAGDLSEEVYSLNSNAACWRGIRDFAAVLDELGDHDRARGLFNVAAGYRKAILAAVDKSICKETAPPFIPLALLADEPIHDPMTATRLGSYYDLIAPYVMNSGVFGPGDPREGWFIGYLQQHGGISMGMMRTEPHQGEFNGYHGVNPLYGLRYVLTLLRRDDVNAALVGFYGQLAQGMAPDTFIGGEGTRFTHGDARGRTMYLPPNSTNNATFLLALRYLLIQDWDLDDDGRPDTLRLLYAVPPRWLRDGNPIAVRQAPTAFGKLSLEVRSRLSEGGVDVAVTAPARPPAAFRMRLPLPAGWKTAAARIDQDALPVASDASVDLSGRKGSFVVRFAVEREDGK